MKQPEFLPMTRAEMNALGWNELDVLIVSGDAYVDHHSFGAAVIGRWLVENGFRTGIVAQPAWDEPETLTVMGRPRLYVGITAGALDSLLAHYTAFRKKRHDDAYTPGGKAGARPNRAAIVYAGLAKRAFPGVPILLGGIEASLRRAVHYDFWSDSLRRSILLDAKADAVLYGMAEDAAVEAARLFSESESLQRPGEALARRAIPGTVYATHPDNLPEGIEELPSQEAIAASPDLLMKATLAFERQMLNSAPRLVQRSGGRAVVFEPPPPPLTSEKLDRIYALPFARKAHPSYIEAIPAVAMIGDSVTSHRGCAGGCSFCSLALHQGRRIQSRSAASIRSEVASMAADDGWKGSVSDIGGPSANMWGAICERPDDPCARESCLFPKRCRFFKADQAGQIGLLRKIAAIPGVRHVRVASGVRHDLALAEPLYMEALAGEFTGGQLKIAPEHVAEKVLALMRKPGLKTWKTFLAEFARLSAAAGKEQYVIPYLMSAFPGCSDDDMLELSRWLDKNGFRPNQVQCFIPTPGTVATAMFFTGKTPDGYAITVARTDADRLRQHRILVPDEEREPARDAGGSRSHGKPRKAGYGAPRSSFAPGRDGGRGEGPGRGRFSRSGGGGRDSGRPNSENRGGPRGERDFRPRREGGPAGGDTSSAAGKGRFPRFDGPRRDDRRPNSENRGGPRGERDFRPRREGSPAGGDSSSAAGKGRFPRFDGPRRDDRRPNSENRGGPRGERDFRPRREGGPAGGDTSSAAGKGRFPRFDGPRRDDRRPNSGNRGDSRGERDFRPRREGGPAGGDTSSAAGKGRFPRFDGPRRDDRRPNSENRGGPRGERDFRPRREGGPAGGDTSSAAGKGRFPRFDGPRRDDRRPNSENRGGPRGERDFRPRREGGPGGGRAGAPPPRKPGFRDGRRRDGGKGGGERP